MCRVSQVPGRFCDNGHGDPWSATIQKSKQVLKFLGGGGRQLKKNTLYMIWNVIQEDFFSAFYYTRNDSGEAMTSCIKIIDICNAPYGSVKEFSLSRSSSLFIDRYFAKIYAQRENYFRYLESIKMTLGWKCKYS